MAADIRTVTGSFSTAPQLLPQDMEEAAARGFALVINNRPDGEAPGQPTSAEMAAAAKAAGLEYLYVPVRGGPGPSEVEVVGARRWRGRTGRCSPSAARARAPSSPVARGRAEEGMPRDELMMLGREAGYDLSGAV